jgi:MFS family permease
MQRNSYHLTTFLLATYFIFCFADVFLLFATYMENIGVPPGRTGFLVSSFFIATTLIRPLSGWLSEKVGARRTILLSALLATVGGLLLAFAGTSMTLLLLSRVLTGMGFGTFMVALTTLQCLLVPDEIRGSAFAWTGVGSIASLFTIMPLCEYLVRNGHYGLYLGMAPGLALLAFLTARNLPRASGSCSGENTPSSWRSLLGKDHMKTLLICSLFFAVPDSSLVYLVNLVASMGLVGSFFMMPLSATALAMRTLGRKLSDILPRRWLAAPSFALMAASLLGATLASSNIQLMFWGALFGVGVGLGYPVLFSLVGDLLPGPYRAKGTALVYLAQDICWMIIPLIIGFLHPLLGLSVTFRWLMALSLVSAVVVQWMWTKKPVRATENRKNRPLGG